MFRRRKLGSTSVKDALPALDMHLLCHQEIEPFSLTIKQGEIFGLVGPIGSGKSTIIDLLSGRKKPLGGAVSIMGYDVRRVKHRARQLVGVVPLNAVIFRPHEGERLKAGPICIQGYAVAGEGQHIERVELSSDGGATWTHATWLEPPQPWTWGFWEVTVPLGPVTHQLIVRAWDSAGGTQPEDLRQVWNWKGYLNNAWHRVNVLIHEGERT